MNGESSDTQKRPAKRNEQPGEDNKNPLKIIEIEAKINNPEGKIFLLLKERNNWF